MGQAVRPITKMIGVVSIVLMVILGCFVVAIICNSVSGANNPEVLVKN